MKKNIKHFFLLTALAAGTIHFVNRFINMTADIKNILKAENGNFYDWKNGQIYYTKRGSGSPLLLIHDLNPVSSSYEWCKVIRKLEKKHTYITGQLFSFLSTNRTSLLINWHLTFLAPENLWNGICPSATTRTYTCLTSIICTWQILTCFVIFIVTNICNHNCTFS